MKEQRYTDTLEREVLTGMAHCTPALARIASAWREKMFADTAGDILGQLCVDYYRRFGKAPARELSSLVLSWADENQHHASLAQVDKLLQSIPDTFEANPDRVIDQAGRHFNKVRLKRVAEEIEGHLGNGKVTKAESVLLKHSRVELGVGAGVDLFNDPEAMRSTFAKERREVLVNHSGALKEFYADSLCRDSFVAYMGPEKSGKSYHLLDSAWRALRRDAESGPRRVAYFQVGDLSEWQIKERLLTRALKHPAKSTNADGSWPCTVQYPTKIAPPGDGEEAPEVTFEGKTYKVSLERVKGWEEKVTAAVVGKVGSKKSCFKLACFPTKSVSVLGLQSTLEQWEEGGWCADVIVVDYADILAPVDKKEDPLHQIKTTWEHLRRLSQERHCCLLTATQVNASSYTRKLLDRSNFQGNHLKLAEVTGMIGINVTAGEKEVGACRLNWIVRREGAYSVRRVVHVAGCLAVSHPTAAACLPGRVRASSGEKSEKNSK